MVAQRDGSMLPPPARGVKRAAEEPSAADFTKTLNDEDIDSFFKSGQGDELFTQYGSNLDGSGA